MIVVLLGVTFIVVGGLLLQSLVTLRAHSALVETTLSDFAGFAADRVVAELDETFAALFLDQVGRARNAHFEWVADSTAATAVPGTSRVLPDSAVPLFFTVADTRLIAHGPQPDAMTERWVLTEIRQHIDGYPAPAPYVVLRGARPMAIAYRKERTYDGEAVYGFLIRFDVFAEWYSRAVTEAPLLPRSLVDDVPESDFMSISVHLDPASEALYTQSGVLGDGPIAWGFAPKAGRLAVRVQLDAEQARGLVGGAGPNGGIPVLILLAMLTLALLASAVRLLQRSIRLADLRDTFVANISHDLRTPLAQIRMFSETLLLDRMTEPAERRRSLEIINQQAELLGDLVDNMLHASGGRAAPTPRPTDLCALVRDTVDALMPAARARGSSIEGTASGCDQVRIDPIATTRIVTNLVDNAIRYGSEGQTIRVRAERTDREVHLLVEDEGPGIPVSRRSSVFERFTRLDPRGPDATGTGIGLAVVRDLAQRHGGGVRIDEAPSGGTLVVVWLAIDPAAGLGVGEDS